MGLVGIAYLSLVGFRWRLNPMAELVPRAYEQPGLAAASIAALVLAVIPYPVIAESLAAFRQRQLAVIGLASGVVQLLASYSVVTIGVFAGPFAAGPVPPSSVLSSRSGSFPDGRESLRRRSRMSDKTNTPKPPRVLLSAFACEPDRGSEPGAELVVC